MELSPRPKTVLGVSLNAKANNKIKDDKALPNTFKTEIKCFISGEGNVIENKIEEISEQKNLKSVRFDTSKNDNEIHLDGQISTGVDIIPFVDDENTNNISLEMTENILDTDKIESFEENLCSTENENTNIKFVYPQSNNQDDLTQSTVQNATIKSLSSTSKEFRTPNIELKPVAEPRTVFLYAPSPPPRPLNTLKPTVTARKLIQNSSDSKINSPKSTQDIKVSSPVASSLVPAQKLACNESHLFLTKSSDTAKISSPGVMSLLGKNRNIRKKNSLLNSMYYIRLY